MPCGECESSYRRSTSELVRDPGDPESAEPVHVTWPFADCVSLPDVLNGRCGNSIWSEKKGKNSWDRIPQGDTKHPAYHLKARGLLPLKDKRPLALQAWAVGQRIVLDWDSAIAEQMARYMRYRGEAEKAKEKRRKARERRQRKR